MWSRRYPDKSFRIFVIRDAGKRQHSRYIAFLRAGKLNAVYAAAPIARRADFRCADRNGMFRKDAFGFHRLRDGPGRKDTFGHDKTPVFLNCPHTVFYAQHAETDMENGAFYIHSRKLCTFCRKFARILKKQNLWCIMRCIHTV